MSLIENVQGSCDMGSFPHQLAWSRIPNLFDAALAGTSKILGTS